MPLPYMFAISRNREDSVGSSVKKEPTIGIDGSRMMVAAKKAKLKAALKAKTVDAPKVTPLPKIIYRFQSKNKLEVK